MPIDNSRDFNPPASSEHKHKITEKYFSLKAKVEDIFSKRGLYHQTSKQTLEEFAGIEIPQDIQQQTEPIIDQFPEPKIIIPDTTKQDQSEIAELSKSIKEITPENQSPVESTTEAPKPPERTLFPDRPSLDELIAQDPNRKTKVPVLTRLKDIQTLKKSGVSDPSKVYDDLVKKGVPRGLILETKGQIVDYGQYGLYMKHYAFYENRLKTREGNRIRKKDISGLKERGIKNAEEIYDSLRSRGVERYLIEYLYPDEDSDYNTVFLKNAAKSIDRFYSIGEDRTHSLYWGDDKIGNLNDQDFQKKRQDLSQLFFIQKNNLPEILSIPMFPETANIVDWFKSEFLCRQQSDNAFDYISNAMTSFLLLSKKDSVSYLRRQIMASIVLSPLNNGDPIRPDPSICNSPSVDPIIIQLNNLNDRLQQQFIFDPRANQAADGINFDKNNIPTKDFYRKFLFAYNQKITIPESVIQALEDQETMILYRNISNLKDFKFQQLCFNKMFNREYVLNYFNQEGQSTTLMYLDCLLQEYRPETDCSVFFKKNITPDFISSFPNQEDQKVWQSILAMKEVDTSIARFIALHQSRLKDFFTPDSKPTSLFFKSLISSQIPTTHLIPLLNTFNPEIFKPNLTPEILKTYSQEDKIFWSNILSLKKIEITDLHFLFSKESYLNVRGEPTDLFFQDFLARENINRHDISFVESNLTPERLSRFSIKDQSFFKNVLNLINQGYNVSPLVSFICSHKDQFELFFNDNNQLTDFLFNSAFSSHSQAVLSSLISSLEPEVSDNFSPENQKLWAKIEKIYTENYSGEKNDLINFIFSRKELIKEYVDNKNQFTQKFYLDYAQIYSENFVKYYNRQDWILVFGQETISNILRSLPTSTDEKRNAFTHNEYDRTSNFFEFLINHKDSDFKLDQEHLPIVTEYIKNFGLAKSAIFYKYFQTIYLYEQGRIPQLPEEFIQNHISSIEDLKQEVGKIQKICFSSESSIDFSSLTPFQIESLSVVTGHSVGRWTVIPIQTIISDFSQNLSLGEIKLLPDQFYSEAINTNSIKIETDKKISDSLTLTVLKEEILRSITEGNDISSEKKVLMEIFNQRISQLSSSNIGDNSKKQEYLQKQITAFTKEIELISSSDSIDSLLSMLIPLTLGLGTDQEKYNSVLRQLVFKKVFDKHQNSPGWKENIKNALESTDTPLAVNQISDLINNTIKDHVLNFETKNQDNYWGESTFEIVKKYSAPFKKNLSFQSFINELNSYRESFTITQLSQNQAITLIPDRGLIGEMSGYMAGVCYTKVYPLLKTYPDLIPYKFVANSQSESPEFIGSTLVFKVEDSDNHPVFLIRAFDIPNEQSVDIGKFFESFIDHLVPIAKKMGIKKIITAGTSGTISNYSTTNNYVINKYVTGQQNVPLKNTFNFNGYDITQQCYLVRNL